jgi:hypothetical protein
VTTHIEALPPEIATVTPPLERATDAQFWLIAAKSFVAGAPLVPSVPLAPAGPLAFAICFVTSFLIAFLMLLLTPSTGEAIASAAITARAIVTVLHFGLHFIGLSFSPAGPSGWGRFGEAIA